MQTYNGRYGPYIAYKKTNYKIPKGTAPDSLNFEATMKIVNATKDKPDSKTKGKAKKK